jgi:hypothetical protein
MDDMTVFDEMVSDYLSAANAEEDHSTRSNHHQIKGALARLVSEEGRPSRMLICGGVARVHSCSSLSVPPNRSCPL